MDQEKELPIEASEAAEIGVPGFPAVRFPGGSCCGWAPAAGRAACGGALVYYFTSRVAGRHRRGNLPRRRPPRTALAAVAGARLGQGGRATT